MKVIRFLAVATLISAAFANEDDIDKSFEQICTENNYQFEQHQVTTWDGYILTVFRIPGKKGESPKKKPPVYFQHGILDSADCWIMNYVDKAPAFIAADAGYDVWLGNSRGNKYSLKHTHLSSDDDAFWYFDWENMGDGDVPGTIEYILKTTGYAKVAYIGHSQGTTQMFWALSHNQTYYDDKVSIFMALGPVAEIGNCQSNLLDFIAWNMDLFTTTLDILDIHELFSANWLTTGAARLLCGTIPAICKFGDSLISDEDTSLDDTDRFAVYMGHFPSGTSRRCLVHYGQEINSMKFQRFDFGSEDNQRIYGQTSPPLIKPSNIKNFPIALFVGKKDELADTKDTEWLKQQLGDTVVFYNEYNMGHLTFMVGKEASWFTVDGLYLLKKYQPLSTEETFLQ